MNLCVIEHEHGGPLSCWQKIVDNQHEYGPPSGRSRASQVMVGWACARQKSSNRVPATRAWSVFTVGWSPPLLGVRHGAWRDSGNH
jgi:hypothetical protein